MNDYPYNTDYTPAPAATAKGEPAQPYPMDYDDPYDDGLNPARGIINSLIMGAALLLTLFAIYKFIQSLVGS